MRSKYILNPISIRANHPFFGVEANFPSLGRGLRGPKQALDWGVRDACQVCRVQSKFHLILVPGKLPQPRQRPARSKTDERPPPMIDPATKDRILEAAQIVDVVSEFVTLRKRGSLYRRKHSSLITYR